MKFLVTGDIHIGDYPRYNIVNNFRLNQFYKLAERLNQIFEEEHCDEIIIAGDFLVNCVSSPKVMHVLKDFLTKICKHKVYYILGNHDVDSKSGVSLRDSLVTLMDLKNFVYMHDQTLEVDGKTIYFRDWCNNTKIKIDRDCDVFISHINLMPGFGCDVDNSKFKLGIFGDYHAAYQRDNMYTTSVPIQHNLGDPVDGSVIILDTDNLSVKRVMTDNAEYKFLKQYHEEDFPQGEESELNICVKTAKKAVKTTNAANSVVDLDVLRSKDSLNKTICEELEKYGLLDIHKGIVANTTAPEVIDLDFQVLDLYIMNYRSIKEFKYDMADLGKIIYLAGYNGSGKSSFINALRYLILGDAHVSDNLKFGESYLEVNGTILYQGRKHYICRGTGVLIYKIDGEEQKSNNKSALGKMIENNLPFMKCINDFFINSHSVFFGNFDRIAMFNRLFNLDVLQIYEDRGVLVLKSIENKIQDSTTTIRINEGKIATINEVIDSGTLRIFTDEMKAKLDELTKKKSDLNDFYTSMLKKTNQLRLRKSDLEKAQNDVEGLTSESISVEINELNEKIKGINSKVKYIDDYNFKLRELNSEYSILTSLGNARKSSEFKCEKCGEVYHIGFDEAKYRSQHEKYTKLYNEFSLLQKPTEPKSDLIRLKADAENRISNLNKTISSFDKIISLKSEVEGLEAELKGLDLSSTYTEIESIGEEISKLNLIREESDKASKLKSDILSLQSSIEKCKTDIEENTKLVEKYNRYIALFDIKNMDSIPYKLLTIIADSLSNDDIQFTTFKNLKSGESRFQISCSLNVDGTWVDFDRASDGQKAYLGVLILSKLSNILPGLGLVILDEPLKHVDELHVVDCVKAISQIKANNVLISSHSMSFGGQDSTIRFELVDLTSKITIENNRQG